MGIMQAPVFLTPVLRADRKRLDLSVVVQRMIRSALQLEPLSGTRCYPAVSVMRKHPAAGLYELDREYRTNWGDPLIVRIRYFFADTRIPLVGLSLHQIAPSFECPAVTVDDMNLVEGLALRFGAVG